MKKKILCLAMIGLMVAGTPLTASAEHYQGSKDWSVAFDGSQMNSNFSTAEMTEEILMIQPGDSIILQVNLENNDTIKTDWYMTNEVLETLEESVQTAEGGAYTYILKYYDAAGVEKVLYDSEVVGGEEDTSTEGEGLHQATNNLEEYFYLDTLESAESGYVTLFVQLDGETQGNDYQDTLASLQMNFAVEKVKPGGSTIVVTGDTSPVMTFCVLTLVSGVVLLVVALKVMKKQPQKKGE